MMDEEQQKKFEEWHETSRGFKYVPTLRDAWQACLEANKIEEISNQAWLGNATTKEILEELMARAEVHGYANYRTVDEIPEKVELEPTPTEMVKRLLEKGWEVESDANEITIFRDLDCIYGTSSVIRAYHRAFPRKKKDKFEFPVTYCPTCSKQMVHGVGHMVTTKMED